MIWPRNWLQQRTDQVDKNKDMNPIPLGPPFKLPATLSTFKPLDNNISMWLLIDLLLLSSIPTSQLTTALKASRVSMRSGDEEGLKAFNYPFTLAGFDPGHPYAPKYKTQNSSFLPGLNKCTHRFSGEVPLYIEDGDYELCGYTQKLITDPNDNRQWLQAPSLTIKSGGSFVRYDGNRAYRCHFET